MISQLTRWHRERRRQIKLERICAEQLLNRYHKQPLRGWFRIMTETDERLIVRLCYGASRPPHRTFWKVSKIGDRFGEVEDVTDTAADYCDLGSWR